jgi:hypothetical protein
VYCDNCGKKIKEDANFCPFCGAVQHNREAVREKKVQKVKEKKNLLGWLFLLVPLIVGTVFVMVQFLPLAWNNATQMTGAGVLDKHQETELESTFELAGLAFTFTDTYAEKQPMFADGGCVFSEPYVPDSDVIIAGCNGLAENRSDEYLDLLALETKVTCSRDDTVKTIQGVSQFYIKPTDTVLGIGQQIYTLAPGERAYVYIFTTPPEGFQPVKVTMSVKGNYTGQGKAHMAVLNLE